MITGPESRKAVLQVSTVAPSIYRSGFCPRQVGIVTCASADAVLLIALPLRPSHRSFLRLGERRGVALRVAVHAIFHVAHLSGSGGITQLRWGQLRGVARWPAIPAIVEIALVLIGRLLLRSRLRLRANSRSRLLNRQQWQ